MTTIDDEEYWVACLHELELLDEWYLKTLITFDHTKIILILVTTRILEIINLILVIFSSRKTKKFFRKNT
jgi:hypothetical protein